MKKIFVITLAGLLAFSMTACGEKAPEKDPVDTESSIKRQIKRWKIFSRQKLRS